MLEYVIIFHLNIGWLTGKDQDMIWPQRQKAEGENIKTFVQVWNLVLCVAK